jgi:aryl-alcohol dehydrogenase-like predicted oxidoreductase
MRYRKLGDFGVKVSEISLGSWLTYGGSVEDERAIACIHRAFDLGVNFFDTANVYRRGAAEEVTGRALKGIDRDDYFLATKVYFTMGDGPNDRGLSRKHIMEQCHASLKRLGTNYIDLYQCHRADADTPLEETLRALDDLVTQGKVLYVGVSEWSAQRIQEARRIQAELNLDPLASNQPEYSMLQRKIEEDVLPVSKGLGIGQVVWSPLAQGVLAGKYKPGQQPAEGTRAATPGDQAMMSSRRCRTFVRSRTTSVSRWPSLRSPGSCGSRASRVPSSVRRARSRWRTTSRRAASSSATTSCGGSTRSSAASWSQRRAATS